MTDSQLDSQCLKANRLWTAIDVITPRRAFEDAAAGAVEIVKIIDGYPVVMNLEQFLTLVPTPDEDSILMSQGKLVPVPRAVICTKYDKFRAKAVPFNLRNLAKRYGYVCAVTGKALTEHEYSREHKVPKSKGGQSGWDNEVLMDRRTNNKRGNRPYEELGLKEPEILGAPPPLLPVNSIRNTHGYPEWDLFLIRR